MKKVKPKLKLKPKPGNLEPLIMGESDRVSYSMGRTISTGGFENVKINFSYTSSVGQGESLSDCKKRVEKYVEDSLTEKYEEIIENI